MVILFPLEDGTKGMKEAVNAESSKKTDACNYL
jgi:hypothetical protein